MTQKLKINPNRYDIEVVISDRRIYAREVKATFYISQPDEVEKEGKMGVWLTEKKARILGHWFLRLAEELHNERSKE